MTVITSQRCQDDSNFMHRTTNNNWHPVFAVKLKQIAPNWLMRALQEVDDIKKIN